MKRSQVLTTFTVALLFTGVGKVGAAAEASLYLGRTEVSDLRLENMSTFGGTVGAYRGILGVEFGLEYSPSSNFQIGPIELGASILNFMGNVVFQIPIGGFIPYGTVGYGAITGKSTEDLPEKFVGTVGAFNFGFGGKVFFTEHIGVRVDYRRFALQTNDDDPEFRIPLTDIRIDTNPDLDRIVIGAAFRW